jgi:hypothetical protein
VTSTSLRLCSGELTKLWPSVADAVLPTRWPALLIRRGYDASPGSVHVPTRMRSRRGQTPTALFARCGFSSSATPAARVHMQSGVDRRLDVDAARDRNAREALARAGVTTHDRRVAGGGVSGELSARLDSSQSKRQHRGCQGEESERGTGADLVAAFTRIRSPDAM